MAVRTMRIMVKPWHILTLLCCVGLPLAAIVAAVVILVWRKPKA